MWKELADGLRNLGILLGFASDQMAWAYIGCIVATLLCVMYGLITWNRDGEVSRTRALRPERRAQRVLRPRRRAHDPGAKKKRK